jgi:hypothetical protein
MAVLNTTVIPGLDAATYDQIIAQLGPALRAAPGFRSHLTYAGEPGWTVVEVWDSEAQFRAFFDVNVKPNLPPGTTPTITEAHNVLAAEARTQ